MWAHLPISWALGWPWPMWPLTLTQVTFDLYSWSWTKTKLPLRLQNQAKKTFFMILRSWPLTHDLDLGGIYLHALTKFHDSRCNTFRDMNYCPVNFCLVILSQTDRRTDRQTEIDAYEPIVHEHRWAENCMTLYKWIRLAVDFLSELCRYVCCSFQSSKAVGKPTEQLIWSIEILWSVQNYHIHIVQLSLTLFFLHFCSDFAISSLLS